MFERNQKILIQFLLLAAGLMFQCGALRDGIILLGVWGVHAPRVRCSAPRGTPRVRVKCMRWIVRAPPADPRGRGPEHAGRVCSPCSEFLRQMRDERGLDERRLDQFSIQNAPNRFCTSFWTADKFKNAPGVMTLTP